MAGRTAVLNLFPLSLDETRRFHEPPADLEKTLWKGGYPAIFDRDLPAMEWLEHAVEYALRLVGAPKTPKAQPVPVLVKAALARVQIETIHWFLDGDGRLGRSLITFLLCHAGVRREPTLYLSLHFKQHRDEYYEPLDKVRRDGDWETWLTFFLEGVRQTADGAVSTTRRLGALFKEDGASIEKQGRAAGTALRVHLALRERPVSTLQEIRKKTGLSFPATSSGMERLVRLGIARELTGKKRDRVFAYDRNLSILSGGM